MKSPPPVLLPAEQQELWARVNNTAADVPDISARELLLEGAAQRPDALAVIAARRTLSYGELAGRVRALAADLTRLGAGPQAPVAISVEPGWEQVVAVVAAMVAGIPFHPLDPRLPQPVRWRRLTDLGASVILTQSWLEERLRWPDGSHRLAVDTAEEQGPTDTPAVAADAEGVACILSGESHTAPLVPLTYESLVNTVVDINRRFDVGDSDRLLALSGLGDEISLYAVLGSLAAGAALVFPDDIDLRTPGAWVTVMNRERVTVWLSTPALATLLVEHLGQRGEGTPHSLRLALLCSEPLIPSLVIDLRDLAERPLRMATLGGDLPAGLWSCCLEIDELDGRHKHVPIGAPLANQQVFVLSDAMAPCPIWVTGRLYFGGKGLTPGYWGQEARSETDFVTLPGTGERLYRSDQLGRLLPDGTIDVVGDDATRISVKGHPLNLRDVEGTLAGHESVLAAAVVAAGDGSVGYVKLARGARTTGADLLDYLRTRMSPYLLPERIEPVAVLPVTASGRVDRAALSAAAAASVPRAEERPVTAPAPESAELAERACELAARVLGVPEVEPTMNLLDVGATSVQLVRLAVQAEQELGIQVDVEELLRFPSVAILASSAGPVDEQDAVETAEDAVTDERVEPAAAELILDPVSRMEFKDRQPGIRRDLDLGAGVGLARPTGDRERLVRRRTHRTFGAGPTPLDAVSRLLAVLRQFRSGAEPKYAYPSAGTLYPVQTYVTVVDGRVDGVPAGAYYYHPVRHGLLATATGVAVEPGAHAWINRDAFRASAFSIYLVARLDAIVPMYGDRARPYCLIEAGAMCQLLMTAADELGLGLCPVGEMDFPAIRDHFRLDESHELLHVLLGGAAADAGPSDQEAGEQGMLERLNQLKFGTGVATAEGELK